MPGNKDKVSAKFQWLKIVLLKKCFPTKYAIGNFIMKVTLYKAIILSLHFESKACTTRIKLRVRENNETHHQWDKVYRVKRIMITLSISACLLPCPSRKTQSKHVISKIYSFAYLIQLYTSLIYTVRNHLRILKIAHTIIRINKTSNKYSPNLGYEGFKILNCIYFD